MTGESESKEARHEVALEHSGFIAVGKSPDGYKDCEVRIAGASKNPAQDATDRSQTAVDASAGLLTPP